MADRVEIAEGDALQTPPGIDGAFDLLLVDAEKGEYARYIELAEPKLTERALTVVDNLLMSGEVAPPEGAETRWKPRLAGLRAAPQRRPLGSDDWLACGLPLSDGVGVAARTLTPPASLRHRMRGRDCPA